MDLTRFMRMLPLSPPGLMLLLFLPAALAWRRIDPRVRPPFFIYGLRWFLGLLFLISGIAKLVPGFPNTMGPVDLEHTLGLHGLAIYARFIAVSEVGIGLLLLTRRFATIGAMMLVPMLVSIIVITYALEWQGTPYLVTVFLLFTLVLIAYDLPKLAVLVGDRAAAPVPDRLPAYLPQLAWLAGAGVVLLMLGVIRFASRGELGLYGLLAVLIGLVISDWRQGDPKPVSLDGGTRPPDS
jgi:uncharacterized membrane protein YphA (DoxX/SURF4 family)